MSFGRIHLICIGINNYPNFTSDKQLNFCKDDAELMFNSYSCYQCQTQKILIDNEATKEKIFCALSDISRDVREEDYIIFSFAGHGITKNSQDANSENCYICPYGFNINYLDDTGISLKELKEKLGSIKSKNKLLILDSCHSGGALRRELSEQGFRELKVEEILNLVAPGSGYAIITACNSDESALEDEELKHGIFTHSLIETLKYKEEKYWEFEEVKNNLISLVKLKSENKQNPQFKVDNEEFTIPAVLTSRTKETPKQIKLDLSISPIATEEKIDKRNFSQLINLIQEDKNVYISLLIEKEVNKIYPIIENKINSCLDNQNTKEVVDCYSFCRETFLPLIEIFKTLSKFQKFEIINNNFSKVFSLLDIPKSKSGLTAVLDIPFTLISELTLSILYESSPENIHKLSFMFAPINYYNMFVKIPLIFNSKIWHPEIFHRDSRKFFEFIIKNLFDKDKYKLQKFGESIFLIDSISKKDERFHTFPIYLYFDFDAYDVLCNLENRKYDPTINIFNLSIDSFLELSIKRQNEITGWSEFSLFPFRGKIKEELEILSKKIKNG